jgi:5-methylcytosine-specific restriction endonuclease McrA
MPFKAPHICSCGKIVAADVRCECQRAGDAARKARFDRTRPSARARGYDAEWQRERAIFLSADPICRGCGAPANTVDHVIPHKGDKRLFWDRSNWQPLCTTCHNRHKQRADRKVTL